MPDYPCIQSHALPVSPAKLHLSLDWTGNNTSSCGLYPIKRGVFMYHFSDFDTVRALPNVTTVQELSKAIGLSLTRTYQLLEEERIPYLPVGKRKILFKEHLLQALSKKRVFSDVSKLAAISALPEVFCPKLLITALRISNGFAYDLVRTPGFPAVLHRNRIVVSKQGFIQWIHAHEINREKG